MRLLARVLVEKVARRLVVQDRARELRRYGVALGKSPAGDKVRQGDNAGPRGTSVSTARTRPGSVICPWGWITRGPLIATAALPGAMIRVATS